MSDILISTIGLFWKAEHVFWGTQNNPGSLLGRLATSARSNPIDFAEQIGIYVLYADYRLVYAGQTGSGVQRLLYRLRQHRSDDLAGRWNQFSWFGARRALATGKLSVDKASFHPTRQTVLNHVEGILIHAAEPPMNAQGGRFGSTVKRYLQVRDNRLGPSDRDLLELVAGELGIDVKALKRCDTGDTP